MPFRFLFLSELNFNILRTKLFSQSLSKIHDLDLKSSRFKFILNFLSTFLPSCFQRTLCFAFVVLAWLVPSHNSKTKSSKYTTKMLSLQIILAIFFYIFSCFFRLLPSKSHLSLCLCGSKRHTRICASHKKNF